MDFKTHIRVDAEKVLIEKLVKCFGLEDKENEQEDIRTVLDQSLQEYLWDLVHNDIDNIVNGFESIDELATYVKDELDKLWKKRLSIRVEFERKGVMTNC